MRMTAPVFVARNQRYDGPLEQTIRDGLMATGFDPPGVRGKTRAAEAEPGRADARCAANDDASRRSSLAAAEVFRGWGAEVIVGEGPGHMRDTEMALVESGMQEALDDARLDFADLELQRGRLDQERRTRQQAAPASIFRSRSSRPT